MAEGLGINGASNGVQSNLPGVPPGTQAAEAAAKLPGAPTTEVQAPSTQTTTGYSSEPVTPDVHSKVVQRLLQQNATVYAPGLARVPLPPRADDVPRSVPKKPAGPMVAPRTLDGGQSPLATSSLWDARRSISAIGSVPSLIPGES